MENKVIEINDGGAIPILSFQCTCIVGPKCSGKSYTSIQMYKRYLEQSKKDEYNFLDPFEIQNSRFTHQFYIAPTADIDLTLRNDKYMRNFTLLKPSAIFDTAEYIMQMQKDYNEVQDIFRNLLFYQFQPHKSLVFQKAMLSKMIEILEKFKLMYPDLQRKTDVSKQEKGDITKKLDAIYGFCGKTYSGVMFQRPKIYLILDDIGSEKQVSGSQVNNPLFSLIKGARHYSVYSAVYIAHSLSLLYGQLRGQFNCFILKKSLNFAHLKDLFNDYLGLQSRDFTWQDFDEMYQNWTSKDQNPLGYNALYILTMPTSQIYKYGGVL